MTLYLISMLANIISRYIYVYAAQCISYIYVSDLHRWTSLCMHRYFFVSSICRWQCISSMHPTCICELAPCISTPMPLASNQIVHEIQWTSTVISALLLRMCWTSLPTSFLQQTLLKYKCLISWEIGMHGIWSSRYDYGFVEPDFSVIHHAW